jgi:hypothetical protein
MDQANPANIITSAPGPTPAAPSSRLSFQSAGAVRRPSPPRTLTARDLAEDILKSHRHLIERLAAIPPNTVGASLEADEEDLTLRAETLRCQILAMQQYVVAFMRDTASFTHALHTGRLQLDGLFRDIIGDLCGAIENAAETVREERAEREA